MGYLSWATLSKTKKNLTQACPLLQLMTIRTPLKPYFPQYGYYVQAWQIEIVSKVFKTTYQNNTVRLTHIKYLRHSHKNFYWQVVFQLVLQCISQSCASLLRMIEI